MGGQKVQVPAGTWVLAPAGRGFCLEPIVEAARAAGHQAEEHEASSIPCLRAPTSGRCSASVLLRTGDVETNGGRPWHQDKSRARGVVEQVRVCREGQRTA
ncbi:hypothetical protein [Streptomyces sp. NBC_00893]|uniref:hypothetical protein n=1 Tax=Streptomyces sp. NBC_00893 TaxID=2975862 RepID=UPI0022546400|nr:hypothetical protein [Streptomyces sp. NBC_00893]MCX4852145.1 hypothetical protein [Streptomyces sp. NBC_00893]